MVTNVEYTKFGDEAKELCRTLGISMIGELTEVTTKVVFKVLPANGRWRIGISFKV